MLFSTSFGQTKKPYPTLEYYNLSKHDIPLPFIKYYGQDSSLLVFGSRQTTNFQDFQIKQIDSLLERFKPTIIMYEGDGISTTKSKTKTVEVYSEMGLAKYIADSLSIKNQNIEPITKAKYDYLRTRYSNDDIMLATLGLQITMMQINNVNFEDLFSVMVTDLVKEGLPLTKQQQTLDYFYSIYKKKFGKPFSYNNFDSREIQAKYNKTIFNKINQITNKFRDQHIIGLVKQYIDQKERIFLIEGGWHAIVCQPSYSLLTK